MVDIRADQVEMDQKTGVVLFRGTVTVTRGDIHLSCQNLTAEYTSGDLVRLVAKGQVKAQTGTTVVTAETAIFDPVKNRIDLSGTPRVEKDGSHLTGEAVTLWLDTEKVVVRKAKGRFHPAVLNGADKAASP